MATERAMHSADDLTDSQKKALARITDDLDQVRERLQSLHGEARSLLSGDGSDPGPDVFPCHVCHTCPDFEFPGTLTRGLDCARHGCGHNITSHDFF
jgi:hypothetical protein